MKGQTISYYTILEKLRQKDGRQTSTNSSSGQVGEVRLSGPTSSRSRLDSGGVETDKAGGRNLGPTHFYRRSGIR